MHPAQWAWPSLASFAVTAPEYRRESPCVLGLRAAEPRVSGWSGSVRSLVKENRDRSREAEIFPSRAGSQDSPRERGKREPPRLLST